MNPYVWLGLVIAFALVEAFTTQLVSIWFSCGALLALFASLLGLTPGVQIAIFIGATLVLLFATRPLVKRFVSVRRVATNVDAVIGKTGIVTITIDNDKGEGQMKLQGIEWTARSTSGALIPLDAKVTIDRVEGVKAFVSEITT